LPSPGLPGMQHIASCWARALPSRAEPICNPHSTRRPPGSPHFSRLRALAHFGRRLAERADCLVIAQALIALRRALSFNDAHYHFIKTRLQAEWMLGPSTAAYNAAVHLSGSRNGQ
jgi:hypothetical protein